MHVQVYVAFVTLEHVQCLALGHSPGSRHRPPVPFEPAPSPLQGRAFARGGRALRPLLAKPRSQALCWAHSGYQCSSWSLLPPQIFPNDSSGLSHSRPSFSSTSSAAASPSHFAGRNRRRPRESKLRGGQIHRQSVEKGRGEKEG